MSEKVMWSYLQERLKPLLLAERLTDRILEGLPDVLWLKSDTCADYSPNGFLELKYLPKYPENLHATALLTYGSHGLQTAQAFWLGRWARRGGRAAVLLRVGTDDWFFWRAGKSVQWVEDIQTTWANRNATVYWSWDYAISTKHVGLGGAWGGTFTVDKLVEALCG